MHNQKTAHFRKNSASDNRTNSILSSDRSPGIVGREKRTYFGAQPDMHKINDG